MQRRRDAHLILLQSRLLMGSTSIGAKRSNKRVESMKSLKNNLLIQFSITVGNQQKWDTFVKERSGGNGGVLGLPEQAVVAFAAS
jgi:hypothetical protein